MADITKCDGRDCPLADACYRTLAESNPDGQSWFMNTPHEGGECEYYWPFQNTYEDGK